jgi:hypothetical protein
MSMNKLSTEQDDRLLNYLDGRLDGTSLAELRKALEGSETMRLRLEELRIVHRTLALTRLDTPSPGFVNKVMQNLHKVPSSPGLSPRNGMFLLAGITVATGILAVMISAGIFDQVKGMISLEQAAPAQKYFQQSLPAISVSGKLIINVLIGLNLLLAFLVLDRTVLRPFFQKRAGLQL